MPLPDVPRRQVPAALLVLVGVIVALAAGGQLISLILMKQSYEVTELDGGAPDSVFDGMYDSDSLSGAGATVVDRAVSTGGNETAVGDVVHEAPEFGSENGTYLVQNGTANVCFDVNHGPSDENPTVQALEDCRVQPHLERDAQPIVREFSDLSLTAKAVVVRGIVDPDGQFRGYTDSPEEFVPSHHGTALNRGAYVVHFDGTLYEVEVHGVGLWAAVLGVFYMATIVVGVVMGVVGAVSFRKRLVRVPLAVLAGVAAFVALLGPRYLSGVYTSGSTFLWTLGVSAVVVPVVVWAVLRATDVG